MRYGGPHNVHKKNDGSDFTRQPKDINEMLGGFKKGIGEKVHAPILKDGYSYQGGEDMVAVGEVGVSKAYGAGRDGGHHQMEKRMVYKKAPEPEEKEEKETAPVDEGPKGPEPPEPPVTYSEKLVTAKERAKAYETQMLDGSSSIYGGAKQDNDGPSFMEKYKLNIKEAYNPTEDGNYVKKDDEARYKTALEKYEEEKARFDAEQARLKGTTASI